MGLIFVYILKSSVCLAIFYLFYRLLLARETFHRFNRFSLLGILLLSCLLPFGRGKCEAGDGSAPDDADIGAVADDGGCSECH